MTAFTLLSQTNYPVSEIAFPDDQTPTAPFILFEEISTDNFEADNAVYYRNVQIDVYLYNAGKYPDRTARATLETVLDNNDVPWELTHSEYLEGENMTETVYTIWL